MNPQYFLDRGDAYTTAFHDRPEPRVVNLSTPNTIAEGAKEADSMPVAGFTSPSIGNLESPPNNTMTNNTYGRVEQSRMMVSGMGGASGGNSTIMILVVLAVLAVLMMK